MPIAIDIPTTGVVIAKVLVSYLQADHELCYCPYFLYYNT